MVMIPQELHLSGSPVEVSQSWLCHVIVCLESVVFKEYFEAKPPEIFQTGFWPVPSRTLYSSGSTWNKFPTLPGRNIFPS